MRKTRKLLKCLSIVLVCIMLCAGMAGCSKGDDTAKDGKVRISVGNWPNAEADPTRYERYEQKLKDFNKLYPDIEIVPDEWNYDLQTFVAKAEGGTLPTLYYTFFTEADKIMELGYAADVTKTMKQFGYYDKIADYILDDISRDGKIYMIPKSSYALGLVMNMSLFREAGLVGENDAPKISETFEELAETAEIIKEKTGKPGLIFPSTNGMGGWIFSALAWNFGADFMEQKDGKWQATFDSEECAAALDYLKDLMHNKNAMPANTLVDANEMVKSVATGQSAMTFVHSDQINQMVYSYGAKRDDIAFAAMPAGPDKHVTLMGGDYAVIAPNATEEQKEAVFKWLEFEGITPNATETSKQSLRTSFEDTEEKGGLIGINNVYVWNEQADIVNCRKEIISEMTNVAKSHIEHYNAQDGVEYQVEEPVCTQDLYIILDSCIQEVLTNKNADSAKLLKKAASDFQSNFLNYEE